MTATQSTILPMPQSEVLQAHQAIRMVAALQSELEKLQAKVVNYYHDEVVLRGDKIMMREYCGHFEIEPMQINTLMR